MLLKKAPKAGVLAAAAALPEQYIQHVKDHSYKQGLKAGKRSQFPFMIGVALVSLALGTQLSKVIPFLKKI